MSPRKNLTKADCERIWTLHCKGMQHEEIAAFENKSYSSVCRVVDIFECTAKRNFEAIEERYSNSCRTLQRFAREHFGIEPQAEPIKQETRAAAPVENAPHGVEDVLSELRRTNALLEKLIELWR